MVPLLESAARGLGYRVNTQLDPVRHELRGLLDVSDDDAGHRIVHVMSHGHRPVPWDPLRLDVVAADGCTGEETNVSSWISTAQAQQQPTLFLLDLCWSGRAARLPSYVYEAGRETFAWVIAACDGGEVAYDGRFSQAVADVLQELATTGIGTDPTRRFVHFSRVAQRIGQRLDELGGPAQTIRATLMDGSCPEPELPFFTNPRYAQDARRSIRDRIAAPVRVFLDEVDSLDARHFTDKAGRHFTGRRSQLRLLAPWLDNAGGSTVCVVTGSPGTGKSALLGALVCAAHPLLAEHTQHTRARLPAACRPSLNPQLAAVQARQRSMEMLLSALADQLHLAAPDAGWTPRVFIEVVSARDERPTVVVDALDEALDPAAVTEQLLLPLVTAQRADGRSSCRVVVGMRPWTQFAPLRELATDAGILIDLDACDADELHEDLTEYLHEALADQDGYASADSRPVRESLARSAADCLVRTAGQPERWGEFLVASVFTRYLAAIPPAYDAVSAQSLGARVPTALPDVLELDLRARPNAATVRALLVAIAHAKGEGIPVNLAFPLVTALHAPADDAELLSALDLSLFYLRTSVDIDGTTLYRPSHQGLADYLRAFPRSAPTGRTSSSDDPTATDTVLDSLLARPGTSTSGVRSSWAHAEPYLLRHAIQHAQDTDRVDELVEDPEFLVHADPDTLVPALHLAQSPSARLACAVYRASLPRHRHLNSDMRRRYLAIDAARYGDAALRGWLSSALSSDEWQPV
ncbi:AAA family ATPase [Streptomyces sp. NPDC051597]|uniref:nSTAND1 domain-containing NTPase n=1 Tax=Streptomyces sp. NPDC051597 TaxID=3155049 RepID=UPI003437BA8C